MFHLYIFSGSGHLTLLPIKVQDVVVIYVCRPTIPLCMEATVTRNAGLVALLNGGV
jgi:hypothetical protein